MDLPIELPVTLYRVQSVADVNPFGRSLMPSYPDTCNQWHNSIQSKPQMPLIHNTNVSTYHTRMELWLSFSRPFIVLPGPARPSLPVLSHG